MNKFLSIVLAGALALVAAAGLAWAGGLYTPGFPQAGTVANTLPLTGNELIPADTQLPSGLAPQTESISVGQLTLASRGIAAFQTRAAVAATTLTAANVTGASNGGYVVLNMIGTLTGAAALTTPTAAQIIAALPNLPVNGSFMLRILNQTPATHAWTLTPGSNVTVTGTATIAAAAYTDWVVTLDQTASTPTVTFQRAGAGTL